MTISRGGGNSQRFSRFIQSQSHKKTEFDEFRLHRIVNVKLIEHFMDCQEFIIVWWCSQRQ